MPKAVADTQEQEFLSATGEKLLAVTMELHISRKTTAFSRREG
jgi:hypothetical protein